MKDYNHNIGRAKRTLIGLGVFALTLGGCSELEQKVRPVLIKETPDRHAQVYLNRITEINNSNISQEEKNELRQGAENQYEKALYQDY